MKKFGLLLAGGVAAIILFSTVGPLIGLLLCSVIFYIVLKQFLKTRTTGGKVGLGILGILLLGAIIQQIPALIGVAAAYVLYLVYKKWNGSGTLTKKDEQDPFVNFEKQWNDIVKS